MKTSKRLLSLLLALTMLLAAGCASSRISKVRGIRALISSNSSVYFPEMIVSIVEKSLAV